MTYPPSRSFETGHYENFPVASILMPRHLRHPVQVIYAFARSADDFADEGDVPDAVRLANLDAYRAELKQIESGAPASSSLFSALAAVIAENKLPLQAFHDLLDAFSQDVVKKRYANFDELMEYCRRSANPIGNLLLHLYGAATPENLLHSDAICSALQLINFWQDVEIDAAKQRIYLPQDDLQRFGVTEDNIFRKIGDQHFRELMLFEIRRARNLLLSGAPLGRILHGRIGLEMRMIVQGGLRILQLLEQRQGNVFDYRPTLRRKDWLVMAWRAL
ncbi:MAG: squalene synthase HpnC [Burkholderiales bacterium]